MALSYGVNPTDLLLINLINYEESFEMYLEWPTLQNLCFSALQCCRCTAESMLPRIAFIKGPIQCFSMQVVINKCFLLNPDKKLAQICLVFEKHKNR